MGASHFRCWQVAYRRLTTSHSGEYWQSGRVIFGQHFAISDLRILTKFSVLTVCGPRVSHK